MKVSTLLGEWELEFTDDPEKLRVSGIVGQGSVHYRERKIYIADKLNILDKEKVLRHELTHVTLYETQLRLTDSYNEEDICEFTAKYGEYITKLASKCLSI